MAAGETADLTEDEIARDYPSLYNSLMPLLRYATDELEAHLTTVAIDVELPGTKAKAHCHFICLDGNLRPKVKDFAKFVARRVVNFAIPRSQILKALNQAVKTGSASYTSDLDAKARNLFTRLPKSGEGGEVLLSLLAETILRLPQLFTKMSLKTNTEMHVHGSDGVHVGINSTNGNLTLYWGESKLYTDAAEAARECFGSLAPFLLDAGGTGASQERDLQLMRDGIDLNDPGLEEAFKKYLNPDDPMFNKLEFRGLCLIGFDSGEYPTTPNSKELKALLSDIEKVFEDRKSHLSKRITEEKIESFVIEIFCLPFPSVDEFRSAFREELGLDNE